MAILAKDFKIRTFTEERAYHNTAIFIFLKAVKSAMKDADVTIGNSLNQGYYAFIKTPSGSINSGDIHKIKHKMDQIIAHDTPIVIEHYQVREARERWEALGYTEKARLLDGRNPNEDYEIAELHGYRNCMYSNMMPSSGYVNLYELRPYRGGVLLRLPNALHNHTIPEYRDDSKLYDAYAETRRMRKYTGVDYLADLNMHIRSGNADGVIRASEWLQSRQLEEFASKIIEEKKRLVLIAGPSSSGKTTTAKRLCAEIERQTGEAPLYLGTDDYFVERDKNPLGPDGKPDYEGLDALDMDLFNQNMEELLAGFEVDLPEFDFVRGIKVFGKRITRLKYGQILVIEGIHSLNDVLTWKIPGSEKFKIYISPLTQLGLDRHNRLSTADSRLIRRIVRDNQFRAYDAEHTLEMWPKVRKGESVNVFPYSSSADVVFNSSTAYETCMLKTFAEPLLEAIPESSPQYDEARRILKFMKYFEKIENTDAVPDNSIMREFIGPRK